MPLAKWKEWQQDMPPVELIREWFRHECNLAIICTGHLGLFTYYACGSENGALYTAIESCPEAEQSSTLMIPFGCGISFGR